MASRIDLQNKLETILNSRNVYFQPPSTINISYPAIIYELDKIDTFRADNKHYKLNNKYTVTLIHKNPDNDVVEKILMTFDYCSLNKTYSSDNLHHYVFEIYY